MPSSLHSNPFPAWHNQPLTLTVKEIENPQKVIDNFFGGWRLTEIRYLMKEWLCEAFTSELSNGKEFLFLHDELMRLMEAMWVIHSNPTDKTVR